LKRDKFTFSADTETQLQIPFAIAATGSGQNEQTPVCRRLWKHQFPLRVQGGKQQYVIGVVGLQLKEHVGIRCAGESPRWREFIGVSVKPRFKPGIKGIIRSSLLRARLN
jgi:hypothetical protein